MSNFCCSYQLVQPIIFYTNDLTILITVVDIAFTINSSCGKLFVHVFKRRKPRYFDIRMATFEIGAVAKGQLFSPVCLDIS